MSASWITIFWVVSFWISILLLWIRTHKWESWIMRWSPWQPHEAGTTASLSFVWDNWGFEWESDLPKVTWLVNGGAGILTKVFMAVFTTISYLLYGLKSWFRFPVHHLWPSFAVRLTSCTNIDSTECSHSAIAACPPVSIKWLIYPFLHSIHIYWVPTICQALSCFVQKWQ